MPKKTLLAFRVNTKYCKACEICVALCPKKILSMNGKNPVISDVSECTLCGTCEVHCPDLAIELEASEVE